MITWIAKTQQDSTWPQSRPKLTTTYISKDGKWMLEQDNENESEAKEGEGYHVCLNDVIVCQDRNSMTLEEAKAHAEMIENAFK